MTAGLVVGGLGARTGASARCARTPGCCCRAADDPDVVDLLTALRA